MNPKAPRKKEPFSYPAKRHIMTANSRWIMCIPVVSTAHITKQDNDLLEAPKPDTGPLAEILFASVSGGWIVNLHQARMEELVDLADVGFSEPFVNLLQIFSEAGYTCLRLDADGDVLNLPTFDW